MNYVGKPFYIYVEWLFLYGALKLPELKVEAQIYLKFLHKPYIFIVFYIRSLI